MIKKFILSFMLLIGLFNINNVNAVIEPGNILTCGVTTDGTGLCWGLNTSGQTTVPSGYTWSTLIAGETYVCGVATDGTGLCWGESTYSAHIIPSGYTWSSIEPGKNHTCGVTTDGTGICWGLNTSGQTTVPSGYTWNNITPGISHTCGVTTDGTGLCWGNNTNSETTVPSGYTWSDITPGSNSTCGVTTDGTGICWGLNTSGQTTVPSGYTWNNISTRYNFSCGVTTDGVALCWGYNNFGQTTVPSGYTWNNISTGVAYTCGVTTDGTGLCWGYNGFGQGTVPSGYTWGIINNEPTPIPGNCYETNIANYELQKWDLPTVYGSDTWLNYNRENLTGSDLDTFTGSLVYYLPNIREDSKYLSFQFWNTKNQDRLDILDLGTNDFNIKIPGLFLQSDELINKQSGIYFELKRENIDEFMIDFDGDWEIDIFDGLGRTDYELGLYRLENPLINDLVSGQVYRLDGFKTNKIFVVISRKTFDSTFTINDMYIGYDKLNGASTEVVCSEDDGSYTVGTSTGITQQELDYLENKSTSISGDNNTKYTTEITESFSLFTLIPNILLDGAIINNTGSCSNMFDEDGNFNYISSYNKIILLEEVKNFNLFNELGFIRPEFKILNINPFGWFYDMTNGIFTGITKFFTLTISNIFELFGDYLSILIMTPENDADYCFFGETYHLKYIDQYTTWNDGELHTITDKTNLDYIIYFVIGIALITLLLKFK